MSTGIGIELVSRKTDNASPNWTTFIFEIVGEKRDATALLGTARMLLLGKQCLMDSDQDNKQITLVFSDVPLAKRLLIRGDQQQLAALMG